MSPVEWVGAAFVGGGVLLLSAAWWLRLWRRAGRFPKANRWRVAGLMAARRLLRLVPSRQTVFVVAFGAWGFLAGAGSFVTVWFLGLRLYAATRPRYTEAYEGFGEFIILMSVGGCGLVLAPVAGLVGMGFAADFARRRVARTGGDD